MSFFDSEIVREELEVINELQNDIFQELSTFPTLNVEEKNEHIEKMTQLLQKQQLMYTRVSLSDDPQAIKMKEELQQSLILLGFPPNTNVNTFFETMTETITTTKENIKRNGRKNSSVKNDRLAGAKRPKKKIEKRKSLKKYNGKTDQELLLLGTTKRTNGLIVKWI